MTSLSFRSSRPDRWVQPKGVDDASLRQQVYGRIQPMHQPTFLQRLLGMR